METRPPKTTPSSGNGSRSTWNGSATCPPSGSASWSSGRKPAGGPRRRSRRRCGCGRRVSPPRGWRKRPAVAGLTAAVLATAAIGFLLVIQQWRRAETNRAAAERHAADLSQQRRENLTLLDEARRQRDAARESLAAADRARSLAEDRGHNLQVAIDASRRNLAEAVRQRSRADVAGAEAGRLAERVAGNDVEAARTAASKQLDRGRELLDAGEDAEALLRMVTALSELPPDSTDLEWDLRLNLALVRKALHEPTGMIDAGSPLQTVAVDAAGKRLPTGDAEGRARLWDAVRRTETSPPIGLGSPVRVAAYSPDGSQLLLGGGGESVELRGLTSRSEPRRFRHPAAVTAAAFDGSGRKLATGCDDRGARVWLASSARLAFPPREHLGPVRAVGLSLDGKFLLTGTPEIAARVTLWDVETGRRGYGTSRRARPTVRR